MINPNTDAPEEPVTKPLAFGPKFLPIMFTALTLLGFSVFWRGFVPFLFAWFIGWIVGNIVVNYANKQARKLNSFLIAMAAAIVWLPLVVVVGATLEKLVR